jgi:8-hydroxy-5-deazaflavin:NADPH oxidoreductase
MRITIIGNGNLGQRLATLLDAGGHTVLFGARTPRPESSLPTQNPEDAAAASEVAILAVPYLALAEILPRLEPHLVGKVVIDATNPLRPDWSPLVLGDGSSAGEQVAAYLPQSHVAKAFNMVFADVMVRDKLLRGSQLATVFVSSNAERAKDVSMQLAKDAGFAPVDAGPLSNCRYIEAMAHLNISLALAGKGGTDAAFIYHRAAR